MIDIILDFLSNLILPSPNIHYFFFFLVIIIGLIGYTNNIILLTIISGIIITSYTLDFIYDIIKGYNKAKNKK